MAHENLALAYIAASISQIFFNVRSKTSMYLKKYVQAYVIRKLLHQCSPDTELVITQSLAFEDDHAQQRSPVRVLSRLLTHKFRVIYPDERMSCQLFVYLFCLRSNEYTNKDLQVIFTRKNVLNHKSLFLVNMKRND